MLTGLGITTGEGNVDVEKFLEELRNLLAGAQKEPLTVSIEEAARRLSVSASTVRRLIVGQRLLTVRIGGRVMVPMAELKRMTTPAQKAADEPAPRAKARAMAANLRKRR